MKSDNQEVINLYKNIGLRVKELRQLNQMTQLDLALEMGHRSVSLVSAAELCNQNKHFNIEHLHKISKIFKIEMIVFFK